MADGDGESGLKHSCSTAIETLEWIKAIVDFLKPYRFFLDAHVVNFFKDRLWEAVDKEWIDCLRKEPAGKLMQIPSGVVQDHWPASLKEFVLTLRSLSLPRDQAELPEAFQGLKVVPLNSVLAQGMNQKKRHEIEVLAAVIGSIARSVGADTIVDVGSGQGYLAQVLSFEHELSVIAIDASSHHGTITDARAKRIEKYYSAKAAKLSKSQSNVKGFSKPKTVTCQVLSPEMLKDVSSFSPRVNDSVKPTSFRENVDRETVEGIVGSEFISQAENKGKSSLVLAGLHACGDLSVTMLRTFVECQEVRAVISIGCCYNLLSEEGTKNARSKCGFPASAGAKYAGLQLGKSARDLACQSAERWGGLGQAAGLHNFELHAFRAAFQMVLYQHYPAIIARSPTIGRQGKALRRQQNRRILESSEPIAVSCNQKSSSIWTTNPLRKEPSSPPKSSNEEYDSVDRYAMFVKFCKSGLLRLGVHDSENIEFSLFWKETEEFSELVGPYWTLRAALGPVLETVLLLDRLLFLQEQGAMLKAVMLPLFDPVLSPRNVALIAEKV